MLILRASNLESTRTAHGFFGRQGGVSEGIYASLNCGPGSGDDRALVVENRRRAMAALDPRAKLITLYQIHSARAVTVTAPWEIGHSPEADAMVTNLPGLALGILTADCAPVLFADAEARVIGAAHAGWKGALGGVIESALGAMEDLGAARARIAAAIGPCIAQASYQVDAAFRTNFIEQGAESGRFFAKDADRFRFDLEGYVAARLSAAGIASVKKLSADTYARDADFFSFRRATHRRESDYGRDLSAILLKP